MYRSNYIIKNGAFAEDCIGLDNTFASMGAYGELDGPTMDLSADGGKVTVEMRVRAMNAASMSLYMLNCVDRVNQFTSDKIVDRIELWSTNSMLEPLTEEWTTRTFTLTGGNEKSYIAIQAYGYGALVQIDYLAIYQNLEAGETIRVPYRSNVVKGTSLNIDTKGEGFSESADLFECAVMGANTTDEESEDVVYSPWSETAAVRIPGENSGVSTVSTMEGSLEASIAGKAIAVANTTGATVTVYSLSGVPVYASDAESFVTPDLASGVYFVSAPGAKTVKIAL